MIFALVAA